MIYLQLMKTLFWIRRNKINQRGKAPIYIRITIAGKRENFSTGVFVAPNEWNAKTQKCKDEVLNMKLRVVQDRLDMIYLGLVNGGKAVSASVVKGIYSGKISVKPTLIQCFEAYIANLEKMQSRAKIAIGTVKKDEVYKKALVKYLLAIKNINIEAEAFGVAHIRKFVDFCEDGLNHCSDYAQKCALAVRRILQWSFENEMIGNNPLYQWKSHSVNKREIVYLEEEELQLIRRHKFASKRLQVVANMFLIQCFTGMDYGCLQSFEPEEHFRKDPDGKVWIVKARAKNGSTAAVPLFDDVIELMAGFIGPDLFASKLTFPQISNQKYNSYLKEIAEICGIEKRLTTHVGRKTFGMLALNSRFSVEAVAAMLGHRYISTTQRHYAKVLQKRVMFEVNMGGELLKYG